jgi:mannose-6-phosphate isomerase-like protein (cupin superfamily)
MENKRNEATFNRPEGDRVLDAPYVFINIPEFIRQLKSEEAWQKNDRNGITVFKSERVTMVLTCLHAKALMHDVLVDGIFTIQVLEGIVRVRTPDGEVDMQPNQVITFHQLVDHSIEALMDSVLLFTNNSSEVPDELDHVL